jgi:hypothetical protein
VIKSPLSPFLPPSHSPELQLSSVTYNWTDDIKSHFSQGFQMSFWSWSGSNRSHMLWVRRKAILKQKNPSLGLMTLRKFCHFDAFILASVWRLSGLLLPPYDSKLWRREAQIIHREDSISDKQMSMSVAIKFSSKHLLGDLL